MKVEEKMKWDDIRKKVKNMQGKTPKSKHCVANAVQRVTAAGKKGVRFFFVVFWLFVKPKKKGVAKTNYKNCGREKKLTEEEAKKVFLNPLMKISCRSRH